MPAQNPNEAIRPDFTTQEHENARQKLIDEGFNADQAARSLSALWTLTNNADKERWALEQRRRHEAEQREEEEQEERRQLIKDEQEAAHLEDRKKNKNKYAPLVRGKVPSDPTIIPAQYALRKMKAGDYCKLHYFTNKGLEDAKVSNLLAEPEALVMLPATDGLHSWVPAAVVKDPKSAPIVKDENLSWENFNEAAPCMIASMKLHDWPDDRVDMHIQFLCALQSHRWRHAPDTLKQRALLLYQSQQHRRWHMTIGTAQSWSLEELNQDLILEAREELFNEKRDKDTVLAIQQAAATFVASNQHLSRMPSQQVATSQKRPYPPAEETSYSNKKVRQPHPLAAAGTLPCCAVCLGRNPHHTMECAASRMWDNQYETFAEHIRKGLWTKDGKQICMGWQREEGCTTPKHDARHVCSGCRAATHGTQRCPRAQKAETIDTVQS
ncbi:uncharacterized protein F5147DRAFT_716935 [Suillus discolor]|uniref:Uncharacterized protein n=1 Tax=Suillus discolor TaxID=1912936 RepID=A0A9P7EZ28_9AGAM|nr:uncharacterized protein F5147DRAFT_716935 [Suillus discolor]KAG2096075.1 hypothetical protein F5147DRAFT_716935 [Suillus discolor]